MEIQAEALSCFYPGTRIASLPFHTCSPDLATAKEKVNEKSLWSSISHDACARGCERALSSEGCEEADPFYLMVDDLVTKPEDDETSSLDMLRKHWDGEWYRRSMKLGGRVIQGEDLGTTPRLKGCWAGTTNDRQLHWVFKHIPLVSRRSSNALKCRPTQRLRRDERARDDVEYILHRSSDTWF